MNNMCDEEMIDDQGYPTFCETNPCNSEQCGIGLEKETTGSDFDDRKDQRIDVHML